MIFEATRDVDEIMVIKAQSMARDCRKTAILTSFKTIKLAMLSPILNFQCKQLAYVIINIPVAATRNVTSTPKI